MTKFKPILLFIVLVCTVLSSIGCARHTPKTQAEQGATSPVVNIPSSVSNPEPKAKSSKPIDSKKEPAPQTAPDFERISTSVTDEFAEEHVARSEAQKAATNIPASCLIQSYAGTIYACPDLAPLAAQPAVPREKFMAMSAEHQAALRFRTKQRGVQAYTECTEKLAPLDLSLSEPYGKYANEYSFAWSDCHNIQRTHANLPPELRPDSTKKVTPDESNRRQRIKDEQDKLEQIEIDIERRRLQRIRGY